MVARLTTLSNELRLLIRLAVANANHCRYCSRYFNRMSRFAIGSRWLATRRMGKDAPFRSPAGASLKVCGLEIIRSRIVRPVMRFFGSGHLTPEATTPDPELLFDHRSSSIAERYPRRDVYLEQVRQAAQELVEDGYLLTEDLELLVDQAAERFDIFASTCAIRRSVAPACCSTSWAPPCHLLSQKKGGKPVSDPRYIYLAAGSFREGCTMSSIQPTAHR